MATELFALYLIVLCQLPNVSCKILGAAFLPHGDFAFDPNLAHNGSLGVHNAAKEAASYIQRLKPDLVFLTTPHGVSLTNEFLLYGNSEGACLRQLL